MMNAWTRGARNRIAPDTVLLCATIVIAPQLFGGAFPWTVVTISALCVSAFAAALWVRRSSTTHAIDGVFLVMLFAWAWTCAQAVPLPPSVAESLGLQTVDTVKRLRDLAWADGVPFTISHDPGSTHAQVLIGVGILSAFVAARLGGRDALEPIAIATAGSAALVALVGFAHELSGTDVLFGVYEPKFTVTRMLAPLMNGNHLAGFSLTGSLVAAGLAAESDTSAKRYGWTVVSAFCALTVAWTLSRGALGALLFGFLLFGVWLASRRQKQTKAIAAAIPAAVVGAAVAGVGAFALLEPFLRRFERHGFDKLELATRSFGLLDGSAWWLGVGRGAFSAAFVSHEGTLERYTHPENLVAQWTTEWGLPVAVVLGLVLLWSCWRAFRRSGQPLVAASWIAVFALCLQNLVDFSLEMAGVVAPIAALLGALLPAKSSFSIRLDRRISAAVLGLFVVVLTVLGPRVLESDTQSLVEQLTWRLRANDDDAIEATLRRGLSLHPSEPALALLAGTHASAIKHPDTAAWLSVAMESAPGWGEPHAVAARWLFELGRTDQALVEVRVAEEKHGGRGQAVLCAILRQDPRYELVERGAPAGSERAPYLNRAARCETIPEALRREIDRSILESTPSHPWAALREAQRLSKDERHGDAVALLEVAIEHNAGNQTLEMALVAAHVRAGDPRQAQDVLQRVIARDGETRAALITRARIEAALGDADAMRATIMRVRGDARGSPELVASSFVVEGELEASLGNIDEALAAYAAADVAKPESPALRAAAALALRSGRIAHALRTYRELCRRDPGGRDCAKEAQLTKKLSTPRSEPPVP